MAWLAIFALLALLGSCNKQAAKDGDAATGTAAQAEQSAAQTPEASGTAGESARNDSAAAASSGVALEGCPISGLSLPAGSTIFGRDDQLPRGWTVSFDTPLAWPELETHFETLLTARGWTIDTTSPQEVGVIRYKSADSLHFAMLMNAFPDPPEQPKTDDYVRALGEIEMARQTNPDFAFGVYLRSE